MAEKLPQVEMPLRVGDVRYVHRETNHVYPDSMFDLHYCPPELRREIYRGEDRWDELDHKPMRSVHFQARDEVEDPFAPVAPYDTPLSAWASDRSGGPSNFHGNGGGDDNPRDPVAHGEKPGDLAEALGEYQKQREGSES